MAINLAGDADSIDSTSLGAGFNMTAGTTIQTFSGWVYADSIAGSDTFSNRIFYVSEDVSGSGDGWGLSFGDVSGTIKAIIFTVGGNSGDITIGVAAGGWYHIWAIFDQANDTVELYVNNVQKYSNSSYTNTSAITSAEIILGLTTVGGANPWDGKFSEFAFWNATLSASDRTLLYTSGLKGMPYMIKPSNLIGYWAMDDFSDGQSGLNGQTILDKSGNGNNLTLNDADGDTVSVAEEFLSYPSNIIIPELVGVSPTSGAVAVTGYMTTSTKFW